MGEFNLEDLQKIYNSKDVLKLLVEKNIIKEEKLKAQIIYENQLNQLQYELLKLQLHIVENNKRLLVIFEGRDAAGKGGTIQRATASLNPKKYNIVALSKPTEIEQNQWYFQRYFKHLPNKGEIVFFDRSWYNRAVVEPVFGFCSIEQYTQFMEQVNKTEQLLVNDGIIVVKIFLDISKKEQQERLDDRKNNPMKSWKIGGLDKQAQEKWDDYTYYIEKMLTQSNTQYAPWTIIKTDNKKEARLQAIQTILHSVKDFNPTIV